MEGVLNQYHVKELKKVCFDSAKYYSEIDEISINLIHYQEEVVVWALLLKGLLLLDDMSKRDLKKYLDTLTKRQMQEQVLDLYTRFKEVKVFYDFAFNPKEDKLLEEAKIKVAKEYNLNVRKPKARRSVAQKLIKHFKKLEVQPEVIADFMLYNMEVAQIFSGERRVKQESFYVSMLNSFREAVSFVFDHNLDSFFVDRLEKIADETNNQKWFNQTAFDNTLEGMISR